MHTLRRHTQHTCTLAKRSSSADKRENINISTPTKVITPTTKLIFQHFTLAGPCTLTLRCMWICVWVCAIVCGCRCIPPWYTQCGLSVRTDVTGSYQKKRRFSRSLFVNHLYAWPVSKYPNINQSSTTLTRPQCGCDPNAYDPSVISPPAWCAHHWVHRASNPGRGHRRCTRQRT
jgi:hypothetical protein